MGVSLSNTPSTTGLGTVNIETLITLVGAVSGLLAAGRIPSNNTSDPVSLD